MFKLKIFASIIIFLSLLIFTSTVKNETREIEKKINNLKNLISAKEKDLHETQLDFFYLASPSSIEEKINEFDDNIYVPMEYSKIFLNLSNFLNLHNKFVIQENKKDEKKIQ